VIPDVEQEPRVAPLAETLRAVACRAVLETLAPADEGPAGLLCLTCAEPREWSEHEVETVREVAGYLALAIQDARSREERRRAEEALRQVAATAHCLLWHADIEEREEGLHWDLKVSDEETAQRFLPLEIGPGET